MEQQLNNGNEFLWKALANPADQISPTDSLQLLVSEFPQSGVLQALLVPKGGEEALRHAAAYIAPAVLHKVVNRFDGVPAVNPEQIIYSDVAVPIPDQPGLVEEEDEPLYMADAKVEYFQQDIDDEIYDEIVSIEDINLDQLTAMSKTDIEEAIPIETINTEDGIIESNYFVYDNSPDQEIIEENTIVTAAPTKDIAQYNDEKMPYTFLWWLDKTRKDHAAVYQPYAVNKPKPVPAEKNTVNDELQQQYYESIFNLNTVDELEKNIAPQTNNSHPKKEDKIIERFLQEEPQIKHPSGTKLDNENKAKSSAEDRDELVTETLARIYTEQMLYPKAISTYKKLMLKFPEKSLYFAGLIEQLEKKIN